MNSDDISKRYLPTPQAAVYLGIAKSTLNKDRVTRTLGLPFIRVGRRILYDRLELDSWMSSRSSNHMA